MNTKLLGFEAIDGSTKLLYELSQYLFLNPELAYKETKAHDYLCQVLEKQGFNVDRHFVHETGFRATFETAASPHLAITVEFDALPKIGHGCGHNLIAETSVATAIGLKAIMESGVRCKLSVFGTPAEEGGGGKIKFITSGCFDFVDVCIMSHPFNKDLLLMPHLALIGLKITYTGKETHASVSPWEGKNALDAAVLAYQSISTLRQQIHPSCRIHGIISHGGDAPNVIPKFTELQYYVRDKTRNGLQELLPRVYSCFEGAGLMTGCEVSITETCPMYADINHNAAISKIFFKNAVDLGVAFDDDSNNLSGSSDMGNVSYACPTIHPLFNIGTDADLHTLKFAESASTEAAQKICLRQAKAMLGTFVDILLDETGEYLKEIKECFKCTEK